MKRFLTILWLILIFIPLTSCNNSGQRTQIVGSGEYITQKIDTGSATSLSVSDIQIRNDEHIIPARVYLVAGDEKYVSIKAQKEVLDSIVVDDLFDTISIQGKQKNYFTTEYVEIYVKGYQFTSVKLNLAHATIGTATLQNEATISLDAASILDITSFVGKELTLNASQSSEVAINNIGVERLNITVDESSAVNVNSILATEAKLTLQGSSCLNVGDMVTKRTTLNASESSVCKLVGTCDNLDLVFSGSSIYNGKEYRVEMATILTSGSAHIVITANKGINIVASGESMVTYYGDATVTSTSITGQSQIIRGE